MKVQEIFLYTLKLIKTVTFFIMGIVTGKSEGNPKENLELSKAEYEFLFNIIKNSTFKGGDVERLYDLSLKLQKQYLSIYKNN